MISMPQCKTAVTPLLIHWSYCSLALSHLCSTCVELCMYMVPDFLCFVVVRLWLLLPWSFRVAALALEQLFDCPNGITVAPTHYDDVIVGVMASQITSLTIVYSTIYSDADQRKHQSSASLAFAGNSPGTWEFPHKWPVTRKMSPFDHVFMSNG